MSLLIYKNETQPYPTPAFLDALYAKNVTGGAYVLIESPEGSWFTHECPFKTRFDDFKQDMLQYQEKGFSGKLIILFISTTCNVQNKIMENDYTATSTDDQKWLTILGEGPFKQCKGKVNEYLPIKKFVSFCKQTFLEPEKMSPRDIHQILNNLSKLSGNVDRHLIVGNVSTVIYHDLWLDTDLNLYVSNDSYLADIPAEEKTYLIHALLFDKLSNGSTKKPKEILEEIKQIPNLEFRQMINNLRAQEKIAQFV